MYEDRFKFIKGYCLDKWIFQTAMLIIFIYLGSLAYFNNFDLDYMECNIDQINNLNIYWAYDDSQLCLNPFYKSANWKNDKYLVPGYYGKKPGFWFNFSGFFSFLILFIAFWSNHYLHNKDKKIMGCLE
jgi:hypothetical protein